MSNELLKLISEKVDKLDNKIDSISSDIVEIKITSARHDENLKTHMKRSEAAEAGIELLKEELVPIKKHIYGVDIAIKIIAFGSTIIGSVLGFLRFFKKI